MEDSRHVDSPMQACMLRPQLLCTGSSLVKDEDAAIKEAEAAGFPVLLKATGGGGGIGIYVCQDVAEVRKQFAAAGRCPQPRG